MGVLFIALVAVLWLCLLFLTLRRRRTTHALVTLAAIGLPVLGGFAGNWCATGSNPGDKLSCIGITCGCVIGFVSFLAVLAVIAIDLQRRRGAHPVEKP